MTALPVIALIATAISAISTILCLRRAFKEARTGGTHLEACIDGEVIVVMEHFTGTVAEVRELERRLLAAITEARP